MRLDEPKQNLRVAPLMKAEANQIPVHGAAAAAAATHAQAWLWWRDSASAAACLNRW